MDSRELDNFLKSRGADRDCPACGYDGDWATVEADNNLKVLAADGPFWIEVTAVICQNCGFLRLHVLDVIRDALVQPDEGGPDQ